jgi:hypothetical protein
LSPVAEKFSPVPNFSYNMACYECQFGRLKAAWKWLEKTFDTAQDLRAFKTMALDDSDLEPLWRDIAEV